MTTRLHTERLVAHACETTGLDDFGEATWQAGLERLADSLAVEAALNELGREIVAGECVMYPANRLCVTDFRRRNPEIATVEVMPPIVIVGQGRTGTTILHDLLAQDPSNRVPLNSEVDRPCPPPETTTYETDPRIDEVDATTSGVELLIPGFLSMHTMGARLPQECVRITVSDFRSVMFPTQYRVPSYARWVLDEADMAPAYRWHRQFLRHLQARHPAHRGCSSRPPTSGACTPCSPSTRTRCSTHSDPLRIVSSLSSLIATRAASRATTPRSQAAPRSSPSTSSTGSIARSPPREDGTVRADRVVDLNFAAFMADPLATIRSVYDRLGLELSVESETRMRAFLARNPPDLHGTHRYSWADTGLDADELRERAPRYQEYFDVPSEAA